MILCWTTTTKKNSFPTQIICGLFLCLPEIKSIKYSVIPNNQQNSWFPLLLKIMFFRGCDNKLNFGFFPIIPIVGITYYELICSCSHFLYQLRSKNIRTLIICYYVSIDINLSSNNIKLYIFIWNLWIHILRVMIYLFL